MCTLIVFYDVFLGKKKETPTGPWEPEDPWRSLTADVLDWLKESRLVLVSSVLLLTIGTYLAASQKVHSTYICSPHVDHRALVLAMQVSGLVLDAAIAILLWRMLASTKTTRARLRTLSSIQFSAATLMWFTYVLLRLRHAQFLPASGLRGLDWLYVFDITIDSFAICVLVVSTSLLIAEVGPLQPFGVVTFIAGLSTSFRALSWLPEWQGSSKPAVLWPLCAILVGFIVFLYASKIGTVLFVWRALLVLVLLAVLIGATVYALLTDQVYSQHPLDDIISQARTEANRWRIHASVSDSLGVAVEVYRERNHGRDPPPNFDKWVEYARSRKSPVIDHFQQIRDDILPFWGLNPEAIRQGLQSVVKEEPGMAWVTVREGKVSHDYEVQGDDKRKALDDLVQMIESFVEHLRDMELPINLHDGPRVVTPWADLYREGSPSRGSDTSSFHSRRSTIADSDSASGDLTSQKTSSRQGDTGEYSQGDAESHAFTEAVLTPAEFREMEAQTCPAGSSGRSVGHWNVRDVCFSCASGHSKGQFLVDWDRSLDRCQQPDMSRLHGFYLSDKQLVPLQKLVPVFSTHKASGFNDILIPWPDSLEEDESGADFDFETRENGLFWRVELGTRDVRGEEMLRGGHKQRLLHLVGNTTSPDEAIIMMRPTAEMWEDSNSVVKKMTFAYERYRKSEANALLPFHLDVSSCPGGECSAATSAMSELGAREVGEGTEALPLPPRYRYMMLLDESLGPPQQQFLQTLRSSSVPFLASIFRTWYTERLTPWVHFVPVDMRFQGLHSTLAYVADVNGQKYVPYDGNEITARGIALEGRSWARKALRREDMEVYLFRLLLEWGRVIDADRHSIGFKLEGT